MAGSAPAKGRIFISYRREETAYPAAWLFDRLSDSFGAEQIFKDVDSMEPGDDFVAVITSAVESCDVLLALIGDRWLAVTDHNGQRRLDNPDDFVRLEIEAALTRNVRVIPILVDGAQMPRADQLPPSLAKLVRRHALELSPSGFHFEISRLLRVLNKALSSAASAAVTQPPAQRKNVTPTKQHSPKAGPEDDGGSGVGPRATPAEPVPVEATPAFPGPARHTSQPAGPPEDDHAHATAQWAPDPFRTHDLRYWDGTTWTEHVADGDEVGTDPPGSGGRSGPSDEARHQPLPGPGDAFKPFPAGAAAIYLPEGSPVPGVAVMPDRYGTVRELLEELYTSYLGGRFLSRSYGRTWVLGGTSRCIVPIAWVSTVDRSIGDGDEWHRLSPDEAGLRSHQAYQVFNPAERRYCAVIVNDISVLRLLETRDDVFFDRRTRHQSLFKAPLFHQLALHRPLYLPGQVPAVPATHAGVFMCGISAIAGRTLDLRGFARSQMIQKLITVH